MHVHRSIVSCAMLALCASMSLAGGAQALRTTAVVQPGGRVVAAPQIRHGVPPVAGHENAHGHLPNAIYGVIVKLVGTTIVIRTRSGALHRVNAAPAFAAGTVSAPLFVGKLVSAEGLERPDGILTAARISRLSRLTQTAADH